MKKMDWKKVWTGYVWMIYMGITAKVMIAWSFREWWIGALVGLVMWTLFIISMLIIEWYHKSDFRAVERTQRPLLEQISESYPNIPPDHIVKVLEWMGFSRTEIRKPCPKFIEVGVVLFFVPNELKEYIDHPPPKNDHWE